CRKRPKRRKQPKRPNQPGGGTCPPNQQRCNGACVNLKTDKNNCGNCANVCETGVCADGFCVTAVGEPGTGDLQFVRPEGVAVDGNGFVYFVAQINFRVKVLRPDFTFARHIGSRGFDDGEFNAPTGIAVARNGDL